MAPNALPLWARYRSGLRLSARGGGHGEQARFGACSGGGLNVCSAKALALPPILSLHLTLTLALTLALARTLVALALALALVALALALALAQSAAVIFPQVF